MGNHPELYVVCWGARDGAVGSFVCGTNWSDVAPVFHHRAPSDNGGPADEMRRHISEVEKPQGGVEPPVTHRHLPSAFRASLLEPYAPATLCAVARRPGQRLIFTGPELSVEQQVPVLRREVPSMRLARYAITRDPYAVAPIKSEARVPGGAEQIMAMLRARQIDRADLVRLSIPELLWLGHAVRDERLIVVGRVIADIALSRGRTTSTLNLAGSAYRRWDPGQSIAFFKESIDLVPSAEYNPYAFIGMAATLRRLRDFESASVYVREALKYHPNNEYGRRVRNSLKRDL